MKIRFPVTGSNFVMALPEVFFYGMFIFIFILREDYNIAVIFTVFFVMYFLFTKLDYYVPKTLVKNKDGIFLYYLWFRIRLQQDSFLIHYEPVFFFAKRADERALVLHIDKNKIFKFAFGNKIRLIVVAPKDPKLNTYIDSIEALSGYRVLKFEQEIF